MTGRSGPVGRGGLMLKIDWDVLIKVDHGLVLRADVFRPPGTDKHPVLLTYGPYGKWLHFEDLYTDQCRRMAEHHPDVTAGSTNKYQNWQVVDPEQWRPDAGLPEADERRLGLGPPDADRRGARRQPPRLLRRLLEEPAGQRRVLALAHARLVEGHRPALLVGELGRAGSASAGKLRGIRALGVQAEMARGSRHRALDALLHGLRHRPAEEVLRPFPQERGHRVEAAAAGP